VLNSQGEIPEPVAEVNNRKGFWDILQETPTCDTVADCTAVEPDELPQEQDQGQIQLLDDHVPSDVREPPEMKLLKQLAEVTRLLEQQTTILYAQQKLLEDLTGRQNKPKKRKPGMAKKLKNLIHKGKVIWSVL
jgi:hypothetical protein